jgi:phosphoglycerol transferase MdoB-like AlkP superfamily enzyme
MCIRNQAEVEHLDNSTAVKAYIACHLELEYAMSYLMDQLEAAGKLSNTVIVMTTDHFPYGLNSKQYNELAGEKKDSDFGIYENAFICWADGVDIEIDAPCCTVDILPTLLNLFGFEYDSRLLIGQDVLDPNALHIAILHNGSFITDKIKFNSSNGKVTYLVDESQVSEQYVSVLNQMVQNKFTVSTSILNYDYYAVVLPPTEE